MAIPTIHSPGSMVQMYDNVSTISRVGDGQQIGLNQVIHTDNVSPRIRWRSALPYR